MIINRNSEKKNKNIWEYLYKLDRELKEKRDQTHLEKKLKEEEECLNGCTFQPEISQSDYFIQEITPKENTSMYKRNLQWKQNVDEK